MVSFWVYFFGFFTLSSAWGNDLEQQIVSAAPLPPSICQELAHRRKLKMEHRQKLAALVVRNLKLQKEVPRNKKILLKKLDVHLARTKGELRMSGDSVQYLGEKLIRRGCPPIKFLMGKQLQEI